MAHDEQNQCKAGDLVLLEESPPYSRQKNGH
jgi:ribosomal protein S17